jgi:hypothetical protein
MIKLLRRILGIEELERQLALQRMGSTELEAQIIETSRAQQLIREAAERDRITDSLADFLKIDRPRADRETRIALKVSDVIERYGFQRYSGIEQTLPTKVISMEEFRENPGRYIHKTTTGILSFPLNFNFDAINKQLLDNFGNIGFEKNGAFRFILRSITGYDMADKESNEILVAVCREADLERMSCGDWVYMETLDFLYNYEGLTRFIDESPDLSKEGRKRGLGALDVARTVYLAAFEMIGRARIRDARDLLTIVYDETTSETGMQINSPTEKFRADIQDNLYSSMNGMQYSDVQELLNVRSRQRFRELAGERTLEILANDRDSKGLTDRIGKELKDYSIGEYIVLSCYFARNIIRGYESADDAVKRIFASERADTIRGDCKDFTGLALHYLREYLGHLYPEKFRNWKFGAETYRIGEHGHCFMKIMHLNSDRSIDIYYVDPTSLAGKGLRSLTTPKDIINYTDTNSILIQIERDAEDLLYRKSS